MLSRLDIGYGPAGASRRERAAHRRRQHDHDRVDTLDERTDAHSHEHERELFQLNFFLENNFEIN